MATSKTIQPTNVTVQIPAMADVPDQSVNSNCIDKTIDGVNSVYGKLLQTTLSNGTDFDTLIGPTTGEHAFYTGSNISQMVNKPSSLPVNPWPFTLDVFRVGGYAHQILYVYSTQSSLYYFFVRAQTYDATASQSRSWLQWERIATSRTVRNSITGAASGITQTGHYIVDQASRSVRIYCSARSSSDIGSSTVLGNIPAPYRPSSNMSLICMTTSNVGGVVSYFGAVTTEGNLIQSVGTTIREVFMIGEYTY